MAARDLKLKVKAPEAPETMEAPPDAFSQRKRPPTGRFLLQVDRQTKQSYATTEAAEEAGLAIKTAHPVVQVAVYDSVDFVNKVIALP
jgi:hypothetical protein